MLERDKTVILQSSLPCLAIWELVVIKRVSLHLNAVSRLKRRQIVTVSDRNGKDKVFVKMIDILDNAILKRGANRYVVDQRKVLNIFAQTNAASMRAHRYAELCRHQHHRKHFVHAAEPAAIYLAKADGAGLQELFEDHSILAVFSGGDANWRDGLRDFRVAQNIVG